MAEQKLLESCGCTELLTISCDICGGSVVETEIYVDQYENTICKTCYETSA